MRYLLIFIFFLLSRMCHGQSDSALKYTEVIQVDGISKQSLYQRARSWANDNFRSSKNVLQIDDKETGEIAGNATFNATFYWNALGKRSAITKVNFKFQIIVKDGKYKYIFSDFIEEGYYGFLLTSSKDNPNKMAGVSKKNLDMIWSSLKEATADNISILIHSLKKAMVKKSEADF